MSNVVERARLTAGGDIVKRGKDQFFRLDVENQGKTAAFLKAYDVRFSNLKQLKAVSAAREIVPVYYRDGVGPLGGRRMIFTDIKRPSKADAVFGAVWYDDIFGAEHLTRFILRIAPTADIKGHGLTRLTGLDGVPAEYASWDYGEHP